MQKIWILITIITIVLLIVIGAALFPLGRNYHQIYNARRLIYPEDSNLTKYPGSGEKWVFNKEQYIVAPKGIGKPFYTQPDKISLYSPDIYDITMIPEQSSLSYAVVFFQKWEDIPNTTDKYLVTKDPTSDKQKRYRVSTQESRVFKSNPTKLALELVYQGSKKSILKNEGGNSFPDIGYDTLKRYIRRGDILVLTPLFDFPVLNVSDENGSILVAWVILRRSINDPSF
jgi:hypothetical protein